MSRPKPKMIDKDLPYQPVKCAAELSGLSRYAIYEGCRKGTILHRRVGKDYRVYMPALLGPPGVPSDVADREPTGGSDGRPGRT